MTTLKELTAHNHELAEAHPFTKLLVSGKISRQVYASLLANQLLEYTVLESTCSIFNTIPELARASRIKADLEQLGQNVYIAQSSTDYINYINSISDPKLLLAHVYVKHMGDLYGGQLIKTKVPGNGTMYDFEDRAVVIQKLRAHLSADLAPEANKCFSSTMRLFTELANEYGIQ